MKNKEEKHAMWFDTSVTGMDNRGEYIRIPKKKIEETIEHPDHYNQGIEVIDYIDSWDFDFTTGNIIKYVSRHKFKNSPLGDLKKARWYINRLIKTHEEQEE